MMEPVIPHQGGYSWASKVLVCSKYLSRTHSDRFELEDRVIGCTGWDDVLSYHWES
jgi:hypothetical protein